VTSMRYCGYLWGLNYDYRRRFFGETLIQSSLFSWVCSIHSIKPSINQNDGKCGQQSFLQPLQVGRNKLENSIKLTIHILQKYIQLLSLQLICYFLSNCIAFSGGGALPISWYTQTYRWNGPSF
jgi:hypothetical protein